MSFCIEVFSGVQTAFIVAFGFRDESLWIDGWMIGKRDAGEKRNGKIEDG